MLLNFPDRTRRGVSNHRMNASYHCCKTRRYIYPKHTGAEARKYISVVCLCVCVIVFAMFFSFLRRQTDRQTGGGRVTWSVLSDGALLPLPPSHRHRVTHTQTQSHTDTDTHKAGGETEGETVGPNHTHTHTQRDTHRCAGARESR